MAHDAGQDAVRHGPAGIRAANLTGGPLGAAVAAVILLAGFIGKAIPPRAAGMPYSKD